MTITPGHKGGRENRSANSTHSYPLSALFVLVAACAVIASLITPVVRSVADGTIGVSEAVGASISGTLITMLLGAIVGLYHYRRLRGVLWGVLTGAVIGVIAGPVVLAPASDFPSLMSISAFGALILVLIGAGFRLVQRA